MFRRRWIRFGKLVSEEGFSLAFGNKSITYSDERGSYQFGFEDGILSPNAFQVAGEQRALSHSEIEEILKRVIQGIKSEGHAVRMNST